ncbi:MAG: hypothetical protein ACOZCL_01840 [Bacillota bacterium]
MIQTKTETQVQSSYYNRATRIIVSTLGAVFGIGGIGHGVFEMLQGNTPTNGMMINAISEAHKMWEHGNEPAFTLIPNFLFTGIAAIVVGLLCIYWSIKFIHKRNGPIVFLALFILLTLVGGGVGHIIFFTTIFGFATRINKPLSWWKRVIPSEIRQVFLKPWPIFNAASAILILFALEIAIFGFVPGVSDPDAIVNVMLISLGSGLLLLLMAFASGFAYDIESREM